MPPLVTRLGDQHAPNPGRTRVNYSGVEPAYVALSMDPGGFILVVRPSAKSYPVYLGIEHLVGGGGAAAAAAAAFLPCAGRAMACALCMQSPVLVAPLFLQLLLVLDTVVSHLFLLYPDATISAWLGTRHHAVRVTWGEGARREQVSQQGQHRATATPTLYGTSGLRCQP